MNILVVDPAYMVQHFFEYSFKAYDVLGDLKYPLIILGIIGYIYLSTKSSTLAILTIIASFSIYGVSGIFNKTYELNGFLTILSIIGIASLLIAVVMKKEVQEIGSVD